MRGVGVGRGGATVAQSRVGVRGAALHRESRAQLGHAHMELACCRVSEPE